MRISQRAFGSIKEALAKDQLSDAVGAAQVAEAYAIPKDRGGRDLTEEEAKRIAALVFTGRNLLLLVASRGKDRNDEAIKVIDDLFRLIRRAKVKRRMRFDFDKAMCRAVAELAVNEFINSQCGTCSGAGQVRLNADAQGRQAMISCHSCLGTGLVKHNASERSEKLAVLLKATTDAISKTPRLDEIMACLDWSKGKLGEAIRLAVEETAYQLEIS